MTTITSQEINPFTLVSPQSSTPLPQSYNPSLSSHSMFVTSYSTSNIISPKLWTTSTIRGQSLTLGLPDEILKLPVQSRQLTGNLESEKSDPTLIENVIERTDIFTSLVTTQTVPMKITTNAPRLPIFKLDLAGSESLKCSERPGIRKIVSQRQSLKVTTTRISSRQNVVTIISDTVIPSAAFTSLTTTFPTNASWVLPQTIIVSTETSRTVRTCSIICQSINSATNSFNISNAATMSASQTFDVLPYITSRTQDYTVTTSLTVAMLQKPMLFKTSAKSRMTITTFAEKLDTVTTKSLKSAILSILAPECAQSLMAPAANAPPSPNERFSIPPTPNERFSILIPSIKISESTQYLTSEYNTVNSFVSTQVVVTSVEPGTDSLGYRRLFLSSPSIPLPEMSVLNFLHSLTPTKTAALITTNTYVMSTSLLPLFSTSTESQLSLQPPTPQPKLFHWQNLSPHSSSLPNMASSSSLLPPQYSYLRDSSLLPLSPLKKSPISIFFRSRSSNPITIRQTYVRKIRSRSVDQCSSYSLKRTQIRYRSCSPTSRLIGRSRQQSLLKHSIYPHTFLKNSRTLRCKCLLEQLDKRSYLSLSCKPPCLNKGPILLANKTSPTFYPKTSLQTTSLDLKANSLRELLDSCSPSGTSSFFPSCLAISSMALKTSTNSVSVTPSTLEASFSNYSSNIFPPLPSYSPPKKPPPPPESPTPYPLKKSPVSVDSSFLISNLVTQARETSFSQQSAFKQKIMINKELLSSDPSLQSPTLLLHVERDTSASAQDFLKTSNLSLHDPKSSSVTCVSTSFSPVSAMQLDLQQACPNLIFPPLPLEPPPQRPPPPPGSPPPLTNTLTSNKTSTLPTYVKTLYEIPDSINVPESIKNSTISTLKLSIALRSLENSPTGVSPTSESHSVITLSSSSNSPMLVSSSETPTPPSSPIDKIRYI